MNSDFFSIFVNRSKCSFSWTSIRLWSNTSCCKGKQFYTEELTLISSATSLRSFYYSIMLYHFGGLHRVFYMNILDKCCCFTLFRNHALQELGLEAGIPVGTSLIDAHAGGVGVMESKPASDSECEGIFFL